MDYQKIPKYAYVQPAATFIVTTEPPSLINLDTNVHFILEAQIIEPLDEQYCLNIKDSKFCAIEQHKTIVTSISTENTITKIYGKGKNKYDKSV